MRLPAAPVIHLAQVASGAMSPRLRVWIVVGVAALAAAGTAVGVTFATRSDVQRTKTKPPPFSADPTAPPVVAREVREALAAWPAGTVRRLRILAARYPDSGLVRLELGVALALSGQAEDAVRAWRDAERMQPDSPSAVRAQDLRHPNTPPGLPPFLPTFRRAADKAQRHLLRGIGFQQTLRPVSAEREFAAAAKAAPNDPEPLTAVAVGLYDKDRPALAFSRLGPLVRRFPRAQTVRFHLGLLLIYFGDLPRARKELALARAQGAETSLGKRAQRLLVAARGR
jgi:Flp pilus assembly protein TadD